MGLQLDVFTDPVPEPLPPTGMWMCCRVWRNEMGHQWIIGTSIDAPEWHPTHAVVRHHLDRSGCVFHLRRSDVVRNFRHK